MAIKKGLAVRSKAEAELSAQRAELSAQIDDIDSKLSRIEEELTAPSRHSWDRAELEQNSNEEIARKREALLVKKEELAQLKADFLQKQEKLETLASTLSEPLWGSIAEKSNTVKYRNIEGNEVL